MDSPSTSSSPSGGSTGTLRTKISLRGAGAGASPSLVCPFYLMKPDMPAPSGISGSANLLSHYGLDHVYSRFCGPKKLGDTLSSFLPHLPGNIDAPLQMEVSSLKALIDKPPITGKEIFPLSSTALAGFRLGSAPLPETYRNLTFGLETASEKKDRKDRKRKRTLEDGDRDETDGDRKLKKQRREEEREKKRKKKKEKKKKKQSPPHP